MQKIFEPIALQLHAARLDAELATAASAETSALHARRARRLVRPATRRALAANWEHLLEQAARAPRGLSGRVPLRRDRVLAAAPQIHALIDALNRGGPVPVRGVALARWLLTDGTGPVYNARASEDLAGLIAQATLALDPSLPLLAAADRPVVNPRLQVG